MKELLEELKWDIVWRFNLLLKRIGLELISRERVDKLCKIEYDYWYVLHALERAEAKLEEAEISLDPSLEEVGA